MAAVVADSSACILLGVELLDLIQFGHRLTGPWNLADGRSDASDLHSSELRVIGAGVNDHTHPVVSLNVCPSLTVDDGCKPQRVAVPREPQRRDMRCPIIAESGDSAGAFRR